MKKIFFFFQKSVTFKIFIVTSAMLALTTAILYGVIFFVMPSYYKTFKSGQLEEGIAKLLTDSEQASLVQSTDHLEAFAQKYNVTFRINDQQGRLVFEPSRFVRITNNTPVVETAPLSDGLEVYQYVDQISNSEALAFSTPIYFTDGVYKLSGNATLQPINETSGILWKFTPYFAIFILFVAVVAGFIFSRMIAKPLLRMNAVAKMMAELDFSVKIPVSREDEIGQLSNSFNMLSRNLETAMTDLQAVNEHLQEDIEKERKIEEKRREFVATVSHELKSPITAVKGQLEGMIHGIGVYQDRDKYLKRSFVKLEEMEGLVKEMLEVSRLDRPDFNPVMKRLSLDKMVFNIIGKLDYFIREKNMELVTAIEEDAMVSTDENMLGKVIHNVIHNAISYSKDEATLYVKLEDDVDQYVLTVLNTGALLEIDNTEDLFRPFFRLDKSRNRNSGGSGLGLYIVKRFLNTLKLDFNLQNVPEGVQFTIYFEKTAE